MAYVKNVWTDQDVERPRTYRMTENQDGSVTLIDDFGLVTDLGTPVNADNMNHIENGIAGAVDKTGDTMTGNLSIESVQPSLTLVDTDTTANNYTQIAIIDRGLDITKTTAPTANNTTCRLIFYDKNTNNASWLQNVHTVNNNFITAIGTRRIINNTNYDSTLTVGVDGSGNAYCFLPNSTNIDGQWVSSYLELAGSVNFNKDTTKNYSLASYLPNDGANYEVMFSISGETGTTSGYGLEYRAYSDILSNVNGGGVLAARTRSSSSVYSASKFIMPIGSERKIYIYNSNTQASSTLVYLRAQGYRRIGTNA